MQPRRRRFLRPAVSVFLTLLLAFVAIGQGDWSLGSYRFSGGPPSGPLQFNLADSGGLGSYSFVSSVGGIAFAGVATPSAALAGLKVRAQLRCFWAVLFRLAAHCRCVRSRSNYRNGYVISMGAINHSFRQTC
jgi:hypothetical protein